MIHATYPAICAVGGLLLYGFAKPKLAEIGRIMFLCGLLITCYVLAGHDVSFPG